MEAQFCFVVISPPYRLTQHPPLPFGLYPFTQTYSYLYFYLFVLLVRQKHDLADETGRSFPRWVSLAAGAETPQL